MYVFNHIYEIVQMKCCLPIILKNLPSFISLVLGLGAELGIRERREFLLWRVHCSTVNESLTAVWNGLDSIFGIPYF